MIGESDSDLVGVWEALRGAALYQSHRGDTPGNVILVSQVNCAPERRVLQHESNEESVCIIEDSAPVWSGCCP